MMSGIRGKNTKPELQIRHGLHRAGFRYRLHVRDLPGKPDLVLSKYNALIFVHGCFWHGHDCHLFKWPSTRPDFWQSKIVRNREVDAVALRALAETGWRSAVVWECALKGKTRLPLEKVTEFLEKWLRSSSKHLEIRGARA